MKSRVTPQEQTQSLLYTLDDVNSPSFGETTSYSTNKIRPPLEESLDESAGR
jgi:hypothetical protein